MTFELSAKAAALMPTPPPNAPGTSGPSSQGAGDFGFAELVDVINPLQHLPGISAVYRELTGDTIEAPARIAGGMLYGGPVGFVASAFETLMTEATGDDLGGHVIASLFGEDTPSGPGSTAVAEAPPPPGEKPRAHTAGAAAAPAPDRQASAADGTGAAPSGGVLTGQAALAALAGDLRTGGVPGSSADTAAADAAGPGESRGSQAAGDGAGDAGPLPGDFMPITASDYDHSSAARARSIRQLRAAAAPDTADPGSGPAHPMLDGGAAPAPSPADDAAAPSDLAERMREALRKYRAMHEAE